MFKYWFKFDDLPTQWRVCVYTLRGIDLYSLRGSKNFIPEIGSIYAGFHAAPWGLLLENVFYAGFLEYEQAKIYFLVMNFIVILTASIILYRTINNISSKSSFLAFLMSLLSADFLASTSAGNAGGMICAILVISWAVCDEHPYTAGILLGLAMIKPQDALIICFMFLLMKRFVPLIVAAVIDIVAWFAVSVLTNKGMIELMREFLFAPSSSVGRPFAGIFSLMFDNFLVAMGLSMLAGIIFVCLMFMFIPEKTPLFVKSYPAFMALTFWSYSYLNDLYVLIIPACICLMFTFHNNKSLRRWLWFISIIYCQYGIIFRSIQARVIRAVFPVYADISMDISRTLYESVIIIIGTLICLELRKIYEEVKS